MLFLPGSTQEHTAPKQLGLQHLSKHLQIARNNQPVCDDKGNDAPVDRYLKILTPLAQMEMRC